MQVIIFCRWFQSSFCKLLVTFLHMQVILLQVIFLQVILYTRILVRLRQCAREARTAQLQDIGEDGRETKVVVNYYENI